LRFDDLRLFAHGSTVATNALLERRFPPTALVVTEGFRDVLEIADQTRPELFDLAISKVPPLVPREPVFEVPERVDRLGAVVRSLDDAELGALWRPSRPAPWRRAPPAASPPPPDRRRVFDVRGD
jgi:N-methylhydantoinase A